MDNFIEEILYSNAQLVAKCQELGEQITTDYKDKKPLLIGLLKGSVPFMAELMKHIKCPLETEYMHVSSYEGDHSSGVVKILKDVDSDLTNRHIILVEDIIDTGLTLREVVNLLKQRNVASIEVVALFNKPDGRDVKDIEPKYVGFSIPNKFIVGFGLDYNELYRNLDYVGVLKKSIYTK